MCMAAHVKKVGIAAIGDELYIRSIKLLGLSKILIIDLNAGVDMVRETIKEFLEMLLNEGIGLVLVQDTLREVFNEVFNSVQAPKVIYLPDIRTSDKFNVKDYYLQLLRYYIGISLEV